MQLEKGRISNFELIMLMIGFIFGSSFLVSPAKSGGQNGWLAVIIGAFEALLIAWIFVALSNKFKDKTIIEINDVVYGRILGKLISFVFIWYLFHLAIQVSALFAYFFSTEIYMNTPPTILLIFILAVCASTVGRGIEVLARCSVVLVPLTFLITIFDFVLSIPNMDINNILPVLDIPTGKFLWAAHSAAMYPFAQTAAFIMVFSSLNNKKGRYGNVAVAILIGCFFLTLIQLRNSLVLGPMISNYIFPSYIAIQAINIADVLSRLEVFVTIFFLFLGFIKVSVLLYGTVLGMGQLLNLRSYRPLIIPIVIFVIILTPHASSNFIESLEFTEKGYPIYALPWEAGIPLITLIVAKLRKLPRTEGEKL
ncbi:MAG TPA: endospore germination permease [Syntrophomonadaceae bacterium]|nr:endospore germination permease [Syntrophomonadaceae bacterium]